MNVDLVLSAMRVPCPKPFSSWNVFQIGSVSSPLNFASQQQRAFWLTWALDQSELVRDRKVGIIGGGLAGVTAASVCMKRGAQLVTLYDRNHSLMALQHGAIHRFAHPFIFQWPSSNSDKKKVKFPILHWKAANAHRVRQRIVKAADKIREKCWDARDQVTQRLRVQLSAEDLESFQNEWSFTDEPYGHRMGCEVRHLLPSKDGKVELLAEGHEAAEVKERSEWLPVGKNQNYQRRYDVVIVAVGYGLEAGFPGAPFRSYWDPDTVDGATILQPQPRRWLVSGTGDGGLIDVIRLQLFEADQEVLTRLLQGESDSANWPQLCKSLRDDLSGVDLRVKTRVDLSRRDDVSREIHEEFSQVRLRHSKAFEVLRSFVLKHERTDTLVYLHGRQEFPYELGAGLFQRFLIYLLRAYCGLRYRSGELRLLSSPGSRPYRFQLGHSSTDSARIPTGELEVDEVVVRHGAESVFGELFGTAAVSTIRENPHRKEFESQLWDHSLPDDWSKSLKRDVVLPTILDRWRGRISNSE